MYHKNRETFHKHKGKYSYITKREAPINEVLPFFTRLEHLHHQNVFPD